jgi:peptide/nickel transport system permease protein
VNKTAPARVAEVQANVTLDGVTRPARAAILFTGRLDLDEVRVSPARVDAALGEYVDLRAQAIDDQGGNRYDIQDATFAWQFLWEGYGLPGPTDWASEGPEVVERLEIEAPGPGHYVAQIRNNDGLGPYFIDAEAVRFFWDAANLTSVERKETIRLCRPVEPEPCETFKAANMLGGGEPMKPGETRNYSFSLGPDIKSVKLRLFGPEASVFGRDNVFGRDYLSILIWGSQISLRISFIVVASAVLIGVVLGGLAGYLGGKVDELVMRITDVFLAIPGLILAMGVAAVLTRNLDNIMYALVVVSWPSYTRLIRGQALSVRESLYVEAARSVGVPEGRIIVRHVIPNCLSPVLVAATLDIGSIVLLAAGLSFIGFGAEPPTPEWGLLINEGISLVETAWWLVTLPGMMIFIFVLGFNLFGDGLRDILDPRLRQ